MIKREDGLTPHHQKGRIFPKGISPKPRPAPKTFGVGARVSTRSAGFSLVELMITMVVFVFFIAAASQVFTGLLTQFKQQSKMAETNIEGMVGLEILRQDIEGAGYGLPWYVEIDGDGDGNDWEQLTNYSESSTNPYSLNDATTAAPRAVLSKNSATFTGSNNIFDGSDYLVIKAVNVGRNDACNKWTTLSSASPYVRTWTPATENLSNTDRVIVLRPGSSDADARTLVVNGSVFFTTYSGVTSTPWRSTDPSETRLVYGVDPDTDLGMPFNRADYYIWRGSTNPATDEVPDRCAANTGVLRKAVINHSAGTFQGGILPLLDCVADMQVVYRRDTNGDGTIDNVTNDISTLTAQQIRDQVKEVRVYILAHEGQRDVNYTHTPTTIYVGDPSIGGGHNFGIGTNVNYRWKLYTIVVKPNNLR